MAFLAVFYLEEGKTQILKPEILGLPPISYVT